MDLEHLVLNDHNTENGKMPQLTDEEKEQIKTIRILESSNLNPIPNRAFYRWSSLESVDIEDGANITTIGKDAFYGCKALRSVRIPNTVTAIGGNAFCRCEHCIGKIVRWIGNYPKTDHFRSTGQSSYI